MLINELASTVALSANGTELLSEVREQMGISDYVEASGLSAGMLMGWLSDDVGLESKELGELVDQLTEDTREELIGERLKQLTPSKLAYIISDLDDLGMNSFLTTLCDLVGVETWIEGFEAIDLLSELTFTAADLAYVLSSDDFVALLSSYDYDEDTVATMPESVKRELRDALAIPTKVAELSASDFEALKAEVFARMENEDHISVNLEIETQEAELNELEKAVSVAMPFLSAVAQERVNQDLDSRRNKVAELKASIKEPHCD